MIAIRADIIARAVLGLNARKTAFVEAVNKSYRQQVYKKFQALLQVWPQFSGDSVSNWQIIVSPGPEKPYTMWPGKLDLKGTEPKRAGDPTAINFAFTRSKFVTFTYKDKVHFVNMTPLHFTATTVTDSAGVTKNLRPENLITDYDRIALYLKDV